MRDFLLPLVLVITCSCSCVAQAELASPACLVSGQLYHPPTRLCLTPLQRGPCHSGEWIVLQNVSLGTGTCQTILSCGKDKMPVLSQDTGAMCVCQEGRGNTLGKCETLFTRGGCSAGQIFLPENFHLKLHEQDFCPPQFSCKTSKKCPSFAQTVIEIKRTTDQNFKREQMLLMESLVCNETSRSICCPDFEHKSFLTAPVLLASLKTAGRASCSPNPCPAGRWPWVGRDGVPDCVDAAEGVKECETEVELFDDLLSCLAVDVRIIAGRQNCGRRRRYANGRCVRIF